MKTLSRTLNEFSFVKRETRNGIVLSNKCGRDFLYFALNFYFPNKFNSEKLSAEEIDKQELFGKPVSKRLAWTQVQFYKMPSFLKSLGLSLTINNKKVVSFVSFVCANLFSGFNITYEEALNSIENCVDENIACAIDIPIKDMPLYLLDHVMFVYGYDEDSLYVFDTLTVEGLGYEKIPESDGLYKLPKELLRKNWSNFSRFWKVEKS